MNHKQFIAKVVNEALEANVSVKLVCKKSVSKLGGWFGGNELVVAYDKGNGFTVLIHEYCHMVQWRDNVLAWRKNEALGSKFLNWLGGKESPDDLIAARAAAIALEYDCERRSVECIDKYKLKVDRQHYIKCASLYLYSYHYMHQHRKWPANIFTDHNMSIVSGSRLLPAKCYIRGMDAKGKDILHRLSFK